MPFPLGISASDNYFTNQSEEAAAGTCRLSGVKILNIYNFAGVK